jgi:large subunit ribosomal protein L24
MPSKVKLPQPARAPKCHLKVGDQIVVLSGKTKGKKGTVIKVFARDGRALVDGEAAIHDTRHVAANPQQNKEGGRQQKLRPLHVSKLALVDPTTGKATRTRRAKDAAGNTVRVAVKSGHTFAVAAKA